MEGDGGSLENNNIEGDDGTLDCGQDVLEFVVGSDK